MDKEEFKRLERAENKAYKKRSKQALYDWGVQFEEQISEKLRIAYDKKFESELAQSIDFFIIAIAYTLHFSEKTKFGTKRLNEIMEDITATVDMFTKQEYSPEEYKKALEDEHIKLNCLRKDKI